jgi:hypothetical protein
MIQPTTSKGASTYFILAVICVILLFTCQPAKAQSKKPVSDSLPPTYLIRIPVSELQKNVDSLNRFVIPWVGRSLSTDQSEEVKQLYLRILGNIFRNVSLDTVTVAKPKK